MKIISFFISVKKCLFIELPLLPIAPKVFVCLLKMNSKGRYEQGNKNFPQASLHNVAL